MGRAGRQTRPVVQGGLRVGAVVAVVAARPVAQSAVGVAAQTLPPLLVLVEPLGTVRHTQALVQEVILLAACTKKSF